MKQKFTKFGVLVAMLLAFLPASAYDFEVDGFYYEVVSFTDLTCKVVAGDNKYEGEVVIPAEVTFNNRTLKVTQIGRSAFKGCNLLTSVTIPDSVKSIGEYAFSGCSSLTSITIPDSVKSISSSVFENCSSLISVTIPNSVTSINAFAFSGCSALENIILSENLTRIAFGMFTGCKSLSSLSIPGNVEEIEQYYWNTNSNWNINSKVYCTFDGCELLKEASFLYSESILRSGCHYDPSSIWDSSFRTCEWESWTQLEKVFIDRELQYSLPTPNVKELTIGEHLTKLRISDYDKLESIVSYAMTPPSVSSDFSNASYINAIVKVPAEALEAYQKDSVWGNFWNLQGFDTSGVDDVEIDSVDKTVVGRYDLNGRPVNEDYKGITIVRFSDGSTKKVVL